MTKRAIGESYGELLPYKKKTNGVRVDLEKKSGRVQFT